MTVSEEPSQEQKNLPEETTDKDPEVAWAELRDRASRALLWNLFINPIILGLFVWLLRRHHPLFYLFAGLVASVVLPSSYLLALYLEIADTKRKEYFGHLKGKLATELTYGEKLWLDKYLKTKDEPNLVKVLSKVRSGGGCGLGCSLGCAIILVFVMVCLVALLAIFKKEAMPFIERALDRLTRYVCNRSRQIVDDH